MRAQTYAVLAEEDAEGFAGLEAALIEHRAALAPAAASRAGD